MKKLLKRAALLSVLLTAAGAAHSQNNIGIGTTTPDASAVLDVTSTGKGMLIPRMSTTARNAIGSPAKGLMVFDSTANSFYFYNGTAWTTIAVAPTNGTNGKNSLVKTTAEAAGGNCATGGTKLETGIDADGNGVLDAGEVITFLTRYICNGANGTNGTNGTQGIQGTAGTNGFNALVKTTAEPAGTNCATGGIKVEAGTDANGNGTLDAAEINATLTRYVCNGTAGTNGQGVATGGTAGQILAKVDGSNYNTQWVAAPVADSIFKVNTNNNIVYAKTSHYGKNFLVNVDSVNYSGTGFDGKMMFIPSKFAFRAGAVSGKNWDKDSIGAWSFAVGASTKASGGYSFASGNLSFASGGTSVSMGQQNIASGQSAIALGRSTTAKSYAETAVGSFNTDYTPISATSFNKADRAFVVGTGTSSGSAANDGLIVYKDGTIELDSLGTATAPVTTNNRLYTLSDSLYFQNTNLMKNNAFFGVNAYNNIAYTNTTNYGKNFLVNADSVNYKGTGNDAKMMFIPSKGGAFRAGYTFAKNWDIDSIGTYSFATGQNTKATGNTSFAIGVGTKALGDFATAMGSGTTASGQYATAMGMNTTAKSYGETAVGTFNTDYVPASTSSFNKADRALVVGIGSAFGTNDGLIVYKDGTIELDSLGTGTAPVTTNNRLYTLSDSLYFQNTNLMRSSSPALPNFVIGHRTFSSGGGALYISPFENTAPSSDLTQNTLFFVPDNARLNISFYSTGSNPLKFELFEVTPTSGAGYLYTVTGSALASCNTFDWVSGSPASSSFSYPAIGGKFYTIKVTNPVNGGNFNTVNHFQTKFSSN